MKCLIEPTNQELFDKAYLGLKSQDWVKSINEGGVCVYRGLNGTKCAVGWMIPDQKVREVLVGDLLVLSACPDSRIEFLSQMQELHDLGITCDMKSRFLDFANIYGLTIPGEEVEEGVK